MKPSRLFYEFLNKKNCSRKIKESQRLMKTETIRTRQNPLASSSKGNKVPHAEPSCPNGGVTSQKFLIEPDSCASKTFSQRLKNKIKEWCQILFFFPTVASP